jgi:signal transduction histidine kinase
MRNSGSFVRPLSVVVTIIVAGLSIVSFLFLRHGVAAQEQSLLQSDTSQLALVINEGIAAVGGPLSTLGEVMVATQDSPSLFEAQTRSLAAIPGSSVAVANPVAGRFTVILAAGPDFVVGQPLPAPLATAVASAGPSLSGTNTIHVGDKTFLGLMVRPDSNPQGTVLIGLTRITPGVPSKPQAPPYQQLYVSLYASATADPAQLASGSLGYRPLPNPVGNTVISVGSSRWLVVTSAKEPLVGRASRLTPWIVGAAGLLIALLVGSTSEILARRRRYAEGVAAERTEQLIAAQATVVRRERLSAVGEMATVIGHELRNPLGAAINYLFLARNRQNDGPELDGYLDRIEQETNRAAALCEDLTTYMREREPDIVPLDLGALVTEVLESTPPPAGIEVSVEGLGVDLQADRAQLVQIITNLITNAYQAMPDGGRLQVTGSERDGFVEITVDDSGVGIDPTVVDRLLEPFFTTKPTGTGLGLAVVKRFTDGHNGTVSIEGGPAGGARVTLRLPHTPTPGAP